VGIFRGSIARVGAVGMAITDDTIERLHAQGLSQREIARRLGIPRTTLQDRLRRLGLLAPLQRPPAPPAAERKDIQQWTVRLSKALIEHIKAVAYEQRLNPSEVVEQWLWEKAHEQSSKEVRGEE